MAHACHTRPGTNPLARLSPPPPQAELWQLSLCRRSSGLHTPSTRAGCVHSRPVVPREAACRCLQTTLSLAAPCFIWHDPRPVRAAAEQACCSLPSAVRHRHKLSRGCSPRVATHHAPSVCVHVQVTRTKLSLAAFRDLRRDPRRAHAAAGQERSPLPTPARPHRLPSRGRSPRVADHQPSVGACASTHTVPWCVQVRCGVDPTPAAARQGCAARLRSQPGSCSP